VTDLPVAFKGEVMLAGWGDSHNGGAKVTFWLSDDQDLGSFRRMTVKKGKVAGQRLMCVLVEIDEQEQPVVQTRAFSSEAHLMVTGPYYQAFCRATVKGAASWDPARCKRYAKWLIEVESLSELDSNPAKAKLFRDVIQRPLAEWSETHGERHDDGPGEDVAE